METTKPVKVRRSGYRHLRQDALLAFTENVLAKTADKPEYQPVQALLDTLAELNKTYTECLAAATSRDRVAVAVKDEVKAKVYSALDDLATGLEANAKGQDIYVLNAGMDLRKKPARHTGPLLPPTGLSASLGLPGQAKLRFKCPRAQRGQVETFAVEWRPVEASEWKNGTYRNAQKITVEGLPNRTEIEFRVCCLGTRGRKSGWSEPALTFVV